LRRAELLAALSLAADLGMGQPFENAQRTAILTVALGRAAELAPRDLKDAYYLAFLRNVGCTADAPIAADVFGGDEIAARGWLALVDWGKPADVVRMLARHIGAGKSALQRARLMAKLFLRMPRFNGTAVSQCEVAQSLADDLGCSVRVREALGHSFERWDGKGFPRKKKGEGIALAMRVVQVAEEAQAFHRAGGLDAVVAMLEARAGKGLDPTLAETMRAGAVELLASLDVAPVWDAAIAAEPGPPDFIEGDDAIDAALQAMGAFADLKSSYTRGHSMGVAELAAGGAERLGLAPEMIAEVRRAGYVHDVGRAGVSASVWEKEGPLTDGEWAKVRMHAEYTARILARPPLLARLGTMGALDHERLDGTGYPHRMAAASLAPGARLLAAADMYQAMRETRPHRRSIPREEIAATLESEAEKGRLDRTAVRAVLAAAGHRVERRRTRRSGYPGGLSEREADVLQLVARGFTNKEVAARMKISARIVGQHLATAYEKIGVTTRAGAAMFAMKNGIVGAV
jgi:HD-GYP domain-containing protein (c-di-GMP phosphodiesterase class II)